MFFYCRIYQAAGKLADYYWDRIIFQSRYFISYYITSVYFLLSPIFMVISNFQKYWNANGKNNKLALVSILHQGESKSSSKSRKKHQMP